MAIKLLLFIFRRLRLVICCCLVLISPLAKAALEIKEPWIREAPPSSDNLAGYAILTNASTRPVKIVSLKSASFERVEMHASVMSGAMTRMRKLDDVTIQPKSNVEFEPGGSHFMLIKPRIHFSAGNEVDITFVFADGKTQVVRFRVIK